MKILTFAILASLALGIITQNAALAADKETPAMQAKRVAKEIFAPGVPGILDRKIHADGTRQVAFLYGKTLYTVLVPKDESRLTFFVRPDGSGNASTEIVTDQGTDGTANTGSGPTGAGKYFNNAVGGPGLTMGPENAAHWQARYETALADACAFLDGRKSNS